MCAQGKELIMTSLTEAIVAGIVQSMDPAKAQEQQLMEVWMSG